MLFAFKIKAPSLLFGLADLWLSERVSCFVMRSACECCIQALCGEVCWGSVTGRLSLAMWSWSGLMAGAVAHPESHVASANLVNNVES